jgi:hypothetical protein
MTYRNRGEALDEVLTDLHTALTEGNLSMVELDDEEIDAYLRWCGYHGNLAQRVLQ